MIMPCSLPVRAELFHFTPILVLEVPEYMPEAELGLSHDSLLSTAMDKRLVREP